MISLALVGMTDRIPNEDWNTTNIHRRTVRTQRHQNAMVSYPEGWLLTAYHNSVIISIRLSKIRSSSFSIVISENDNFVVKYSFKNTVRHYLNA